MIHFHKLVGLSILLIYKRIQAGREKLKDCENISRKWNKTRPGQFFHKDNINNQPWFFIVTFSVMKWTMTNLHCYSNQSCWRWSSLLHWWKSCSPWWCSAWLPSWPCRLISWWIVNFKLINVQAGLSCCKSKVHCRLELELELDCTTAMISKHWSEQTDSV